MPTFPKASLARFAPKSGQIVAIQDKIGLHFVDTKTGMTKNMLDNPNYVAMEFSPCDTFLIACEKFNPNKPSENLHVINVNTGEIVVTFEWRKTPKDGPKSLKFMQDESYCFRLVAQQGQTKEPNSIEVYKDCDFSTIQLNIIARFPVKPAKKSDPVTFVPGKFDGLDMCPRNPEKADGPFYLLAW